jgi:CRP-like cAMP-binding protein
MSSPSREKTASRSERIQGALAKVPLFAELEATARTELARCARLQEVQADQIVIERGDAAHALFAIVQGKLKVVAPRPGGRDAVLHILGHGDVFGEVALFQERGRTARVVALEPGILLVLDRRDVMRLIAQSGELAARVLALMARRLSDTIAHFDATTSLEVPQRLALKLLSLCELFGERQSDGSTRMMLTLSQSELAELVDCSRQTVNRLLCEWRDRGILAVEDGRLTLRDAVALRALAES